MDTFAFLPLNSGQLHLRMPIPDIPTENTIEKNGMSRQRPAVPLRQRPLPASFWQEPNRPVMPKMAEMFPFYFGPTYQRSLIDQMLAYKQFIDKIQTSSTRGTVPISPRYPLTKFLNYNYGFKNETMIQNMFPNNITSDKTASLHTCSVLPGLYSSTALPVLHKNYLECNKLNSVNSSPLSGDSIKSVTLVKPIATKSASTLSKTISTQRYHPFVLGTK